MENSGCVREGPPSGETDTKFLPCTSVRDVRYSCGYCGYELNLSSSNRNTSTIGSKYSKSIKRGVISFFNVDESRFTLVDEFQCIPIPYFSKHSWGLFRRRTKLLCRKCGHSIGIAYRQKALSDRLISDEPNLPASDKVSFPCKYNVRIRALQPSSSEELRVPHFIQ
ncbi:uncharacterized protein At4g08330, chloroplastic-like [Punica granatum]|uniref:Uncharacterized protein At4g08330, chloroplastic-like n=2 Tax=Punica granatum TaxID=22663 RepID=A0A6P8BVP2_PUNGR|nr:uncharacterized protein At4g08330, chloroplastic-like [Punica granatum]PKI41281.1 hypothetical protein CRG98_038331 [Punica granatum]